MPLLGASLNAAIAPLLVGDAKCRASEERGTDMALYRVQYRLKSTKEVIESEPARDAVIDDTLFKRSKTVTILRDSEGIDHPANAGKFFLHRIVK